MCLMLVVDDDDLVREAAVMILASRGHEIIHARDGLEALMVYNSKYHEIHLVLMDIIMPKKDGLSVLKELRIAEEKAPRRKIVMLTVLTADECLNTAMSAGADDYLDKTNLTPGQVVERVKALLAAG